MDGFEKGDTRIRRPDGTRFNSADILHGWPRVRHWGRRDRGEVRDGKVYKGMVRWSRLDAGTEWVGVGRGEEAPLSFHTRPTASALPRPPRRAPCTHSSRKHFLSLQPL